MALLQIGKPFTPSKVMDTKIMEGYEYIFKVGNLVFKEYSLSLLDLNTPFIKLKSQRGELIWNTSDLASIRPIQIAFVDILNLGNSAMQQPIESIWTYGYIVEQGIEINMIQDYTSLDKGRNGLIEKLYNLEMSRLLK